MIGLKNPKITHIKNDWFRIFISNIFYLYNSKIGYLGRFPNNINLEKVINYIENKDLKSQILFNDKLEDRVKSSRLMLFLTADCNLKCIYCHCNSGEYKKGKMSSEYAIGVIDKFIKNIYIPYQEKETLRITFMGGGDPFLEIDTIKKIDQKLRNLKIPFEYTIVTNGTIGTKNDWKWLIENNFNITISADGPPKIQDTQRIYAKNNKGTSKVLEKNFNLIHQLGGKINIRTTVMNTSQKNIDAICAYFMNFKCIESHHLEPVSFAGRAKEIEHISEIEFYTNFFKYYSKYLFGDPKRYKSSWFRPFRKSIGFCGATSYNAVVTHDGFVSLCSEVDSITAETMDYGGKYICAKVEDENAFISTKAREFSEKYIIDNIDMCKNCIIKYKCGGGCYVKRDRDFKDNNIFYKAYCTNSINLVMSYLISMYESKN